MKNIIIVHYHEIALKGGNRDYFENCLLANIKKSLINENIGGVFRLFGRIIVMLTKKSDIVSIKEKLKKVFGIAYFAFGFEGARDFEKLKEDIWQSFKLFDVRRQTISFRITTKRSDKSYSMDSREMDRQMGSYVWQKLEEVGKTPKVDLENPDINIIIEITGQGIFFYFVFNHHCEEQHQGATKQSLGKIPGLNGLPVGTAGKVVSLISGGFDSPVASWKIMRRGANVIFVHFHSYPSTSLVSKENVREIIEILNQYQYKSKAYFVPFLDIQKEIMLNCDPSYGVVLYRRFMLRLAEKIAKKEKVKALVTGDSLGQVASQTLENIAVISQAVKMPILRPLAGENKEETIEWARKIGTFNISSRPQDDCCSLFIPKHPITKAQIEIVKEMEKKLDIKRLIKDALNKTETYEFK